MSQIFISHVEEDESIALEIARGLEAAGHSTWYYERDSLPGLSYLDQIDEAIEQCQAVVVIISLASLSSWQVDKEVERAHESGKHFVPVLRGVKHVEFQTRKRGWRMAMGVSTSISVPADGASTIVPRIVAGLRRLVINSEEPVSSPPVSGQKGAQDVSFSEPADHSAETGEARLLQNEAVAEPPLLEATPTVSDVGADSPQSKAANQLAVDVPISSERIAAPTHRTLPGIGALLRRVKTRAALIVLAVLVFIGFAFYGLTELKSRGLVTNSNQSQSKQTEPSPVVSGQSPAAPVEQAAQSKRIEPASSLAGTNWIVSSRSDGVDTVGSKIAFESNGSVQYRRRGEQDVWASGDWEQNGNSVKFDLSMMTSYQVVISPDGNEMNGKMTIQETIPPAEPRSHSVSVRLTRVH